jgi:hypothetical protein
VDHLWRNFGTISASDLKNNIQSMYTPWNPANPIETIFHRLTDAITYSTAGRDPISEAAAVRAGYDVLEHSGLFPRACETWRTALPDTHTLANLRTSFKVADTDRKRTVTTGALGYANALSAPSSAPPPPFNCVRHPQSPFFCSLCVAFLCRHHGENVLLDPWIQQ